MICFSEHLAAVSIFSGMGSMYSSDWSWGWRNRFYSIGVFFSVEGGVKEGEEED